MGVWASLRWGLGGVVVCVALQAGCDDAGGGLRLPSDGGGQAEPNLGEEMFRALEQDLFDSCGACHQQGGSADTPFLGVRDGEPDPYVAITSWPGIIVKDADASLLITWPRVGQHTGGPTLKSLEDKLIAWLDQEAEAVAAVEAGKPVIPPFRPIVPGFNAVYLDPLGADYTGMAVTFLAEELTATTLSLTNLEVHPTTKKGVHIEHPLFTVYPESAPDGMPDPVDSFSNLVQDIEAGISDDLGPGTLILTNWQTGGKLSIAFERIEAIDPTAGEGGGGTVGGVCNAVQAFVDNVAGPLGNCTSCHGGANATATNAVDMSDLDSDPAATCGQIRNRVNLQTPAASQLFITTDPGGNAGHPFKFGGDAGAFNAFVSSVSVWIQQEGS